MYIDLRKSSLKKIRQFYFMKFLIQLKGDFFGKNSNCTNSVTVFGPLKNSTGNDK